MLAFILFNFCFLFREACTCIGQLALNEAGGVFRVLLLSFQILVDEYICQFTCNLLSDLWTFPLYR